MPKVRAILFDRDGTLVVNVPYNGDPHQVVAMPGARAALTLARSAGLSLGVVSNQSGVGRGLITMADVDKVNRHVADLVGPIDGWFICPHAPIDGCACRKPSPRLILQAAYSFRCLPGECVVLGDLRSDIDAAIAAGARSILIPTTHTPSHDVERAPERAGSLQEAVEMILSGLG